MQRDRIKEAETMSRRVYQLDLSDEDVKRLALRAGAYGLTASELLENFVGDFINGTHTNGSDERECVEAWLERCWFYHLPEENLVRYICLCDDSFSLFGILDEIEETEKLIANTETTIQEPGNEWKDIFINTHCGPNPDDYKLIPKYGSVEEFILDEKQCLQDYERDLKFSLESLEDYKNEFAKYMNNRQYEWKEELEKAKIWYNELKARLNE